MYVYNKLINKNTSFSVLFVFFSLSFFQITFFFFFAFFLNSSIKNSSLL